MSEFKYEIGDIVGVYKILDRWKEPSKNKRKGIICYYKCQCTKCGNILEQSPQSSVIRFTTRDKCFKCDSGFKYNINDIIGNYKVIDRWVTEYCKSGSKYSHLRKYYKLECLDCGFKISKREEDATEQKLNSVGCRGCMRTIKTARFKVGDIINNQQVLSVYKGKSKNKTSTLINYYHMKCLKCGYEYDIDQGNLLAGKGCAVCAGNKIVSGINDIATTAPWMVPLFNNPDDAKRLGVGSKEKVIFKCPHCGTLTQPLSAYGVYTTNHVPCRACGDGFSIPEKFMFNILQANNIKFKPQKSFEWSNNRFYDFFLEEYNTIIETHGLQHYNNRCYSGYWEGNLEETQKNDIYKEQMALEHGINYIVINCSESNYNFLLNNYKESLRDIIDTSSDYYDEYILGLKPKTIIAKDLWNNKNMSIKEISEEIKVNECTVREYLRRLRELNLLTRPYGASYI